MEKIPSLQVPTARWGGRPVDKQCNSLSLDKDTCPGKKRQDPPGLPRRQRAHAGLERSSCSLQAGLLGGAGGGGSTSPLPHACPSLRFLSVPANVGWPLCWNPWAEAPVSDHYYDPIRSGVPDSKRPPTKRCNYNCKRAWGEGQPKCSWTRIRILQIVSQRGRGMQLRIKEMW